ncbi:MAG: heme o synthase [Gemmatimonadetes bacterium]|nr:heme o synthase [Gemmatimonadota bacterium]MBT8405316.1 heme o synthase [Gemmatimonadota bacterium]NNK64066.1 protoheme IX farnesyltransferase [Gemmatimonadota bacterium]
MAPTASPPPNPSTARPAFGRPKPPRHPLYELTKPGIAGFVMITAGASFHVASGGRPEWLPLLHTLGGTGLATGGALALNQYVERDLDARMRRTRNRPIPSGRIAPGSALAFGLALLAVGVVWLAATVGWMPAAYTALSAAAYILLYTPLKRRSYFATLVGAVPGALPALIGWTAAGVAPSLGAWVLFGIFFLWQLPHVLALAWLLREDYERVGFFLSPPSDPDGRRIGRHMVYHTISLALVSVAPSLLGLTGWIYGIGAVALSLAMLATCAVASREMSFPQVKRVFFASLLYQPLLLGLLLVDTAPLS